jgi:hypothetical protein
MAIDIGTGSTITFSSSYFATILSIEWSGMKRDAIPTSTMATTGGRTFVPSDTYDPGELQVEFQYDSAKSPITPMTAVAETVTLLFPGAALSLAASGYMTDMSITDRFEPLITAKATIKFTGAITPDVTP